MHIIQANLDDIEEIKNIIDVIYTSFVFSNLHDSTKRLIQRMEQLYGPNYNYSYTSAHLKTSTIFFVAKEHDHIIGMVRWTPEKISNLYISPPWHWQWVGKQLLERFEQEAKDRWSSGIRLKSSTYALPFYLHNGYALVEDRIFEKHF